MSSQHLSKDGDDQPVKKLKTETPTKHIILLEDFQFIRSLNASAEQKGITLLARHKQLGSEAVFFLNKLAFDEKAMPRLFTSGAFAITPQFDNDIYYKSFILEQASSGDVASDAPAKQNNVADDKFSFSGIQLSAIWPATPKHVAKYTHKQFFRFLESYHTYSTVTKPYLHANNMFSLDWVDNILTGKKEADRVLLNDPEPTTGFVLLPDLKWDTKNVSSLYCMAITRARVASIRELSAENLPLLKRLRDECTTVIEKKYEVPPALLRLSFHYHPSFWHLHVHITHLNFNAPGQSVDRAHLLDHVIENIEMCGDYYQRVALSVNVAENDKLSGLLSKPGLSDDL